MNKILRFWLLATLVLTFFTPAPAQAAAPHYAFSVSLGTYDDIRDEAGYTASAAVCVVAGGAGVGAAGV